MLSTNAIGLFGCCYCDVVAHVVLDVVEVCVLFSLSLLSLLPHGWLLMLFQFLVWLVSLFLLIYVFNVLLFGWFLCVASVVLTAEMMAFAGLRSCQTLN